MKVKISVIDFGDMIVELDEKSAPKTVENFLNLVDDKFYDGLTFHRVIPGFMIQGCLLKWYWWTGLSNCWGFASNGIVILYVILKVLFQWQEPWIQIVLEVNFSMHENSPHLDGDYAAFGKIGKACISWMKLQR